MYRFAGDANDDFVVEITSKTRGRRDRQARHRLKTLRSEFRLRHALSGCYLFSHKVKLPEWGFEQQEVSFRPQGEEVQADGIGHMQQEPYLGQLVMVHRDCKPCSM
jgi:dolichyl-phosphate-mannose--protein O-mannosyl transferase